MSVYFGGIPTKREVDLLMEQVEATPGTTVSYEKVARLIEVKVKSNRFLTVTNVWRRRLFRERMIQSEAFGGAFHWLSADEAHDVGLRDMHRVGRSTGRLRTRIEAVRTAELSEPRRDKHHLMRREIMAVHEAFQKSAKALAEPKPVSSVVRLAGESSA
jgi:Ca2+-binding EF-hand superfamily protein